MPKVSTAGVSIDFTPLPVGDYRVAVETAESRTSNAGKPAFRIVLAVVSPEEHQGRKLFENGTLDPEKNLFGIKRALTALGVDPDILEDTDGFDTDEIFPEIIGNEADVHVTLEDRQDKPGTKSNRVNWIIDAKSGW